MTDSDTAMRLLFLRGQVPSDRPKEQIMFSDLSLNDDMWTQLASALVGSIGAGEIWYEKGDREQIYRSNFIERWVSRYSEVTPPKGTNVLFGRGGFKLYDCLANALDGQAVRIYYGAGGRAVPKPGRPYDIYLVDTERQLHKAQQRNLAAYLWAKPAAENIFTPQDVSDTPEFDLIHVGNFNPNANKGHEFVFNRARTYGFKVLSVGTVPSSVRKKHKHVTFAGWVERRLLPSFYAKAKVAVICCTGKDSCPRVLPEALACNKPILVHEDTNVDHGVYITADTGQLTRKETFRADVEYMLDNWRSFKPYDYYIQNLSIQRAVEQISDLIVKHR